MKNNSLKYCNSLSGYSRFITRVVGIGDVPLGGNYPIRIQSMTTTDTMNTEATVEQSIRIIESGADYIRITAPSVKDAENLSNIKSELRKRGYRIPLIADIHFVPKAAEVAAKIVEKIRINPGNYADRKKFKVFEISDEMYRQELDRIRKEFTPLVKICKEYGTAMRIGTNHGSLSDRIMNRFGDTPLGMVESALEFVRICEELGYYSIVLSMKASNTKIMIAAYRLLMNKMMDEGMNYPVHLGVTEAGDGLDGRIKSAFGIGSLLEDGIGDTIRVSLTEEPELEIPVCRKIIERYSNREITNNINTEDVRISGYNPFIYNRRITTETDRIGNDRVPVVILSLDDDADFPSAMESVNCKYDSSADKWKTGDNVPDYVLYPGNYPDISFPSTPGKIIGYSFWKNLHDKSGLFPLFTQSEYIKAEKKSFGLNFVECSLSGFSKEFLGAISKDKFCVPVLYPESKDAMTELRLAFIKLSERGITSPVIIKITYKESDWEKIVLYSSSDFGGLLADGFGDGIWLEAKGHSLKDINELSFTILQAAGVRISKTEYISCPSCGRTQFDLMETTARIREKTKHLKGVKIAIMGCIVNGPGEMADADYGYVGSGPGFISLYKGREVIKRGIPSSEALTKLIDLIKEDGRWVE